jgi:hypothetical protein
MRIQISDRSHLCSKDEYGEMIFETILVVGSTGSGKGLVDELIAEDDHNNGNLIIFIADPKQEIEAGFSMFYPEAKYHLNNLKAIGKAPGKKLVKLYHPFTFKIPKEYLPEYNFYTIPIKDLGKHEWGLIAETFSESEAVSLLMKASAEISNEDGIFAFAHYIQDAIKGKMKNRKRVADWKNFGVEAGSGTMKELSRITNYIRPFQDNFFLSKKNPNKNNTNLNWKDILTDQEHYHVFVTNFLDFNTDDKIIGFTILYLLESIIRNKQYLKCPVTIICPELKNVVPFKPTGFREFLADSFTKVLSMIRSTGRGMKFVGDTQSWGNLDKSVKDVIRTTLLGQLSGNDIEEVSKKWVLTREFKEFLRFPTKRNSFIIAESNNFQPFTFYLPSQMHKEPKYNFFEMYRKHSAKDSATYPMKNYSQLIKDMRKEFKDEEDKFKKKVNKREQEEEAEEERIAKEKETKSSESIKVNEKVEKAKETIDKSKEMLKKLCWEMFNDESIDKKERSYRKIAEKFRENGVKTHVTAKNYIDYWQNKIDEEKLKSYEDKFIEEEDGKISTE